MRVFRWAASENPVSGPGLAVVVPIFVSVGNAALDGAFRYTGLHRDGPAAAPPAVALLCAVSVCVAAQAAASSSQGAHCVVSTPVGHVGLRRAPDGVGIADHRVDSTPLTTVLAPEEVEDLLPEFVASGAVEEEVNGMVDVHEELRERSGQVFLSRKPK